MKWAVYTTTSSILCLSLLSGLSYGLTKDGPADQTLLQDTAVNPRADNSGMNIVHDGKVGLSADQQSNRPDDLDLTRDIRRGLVKNKNLSLYARNVKIITRDGLVVLKGPVRSLAEKQAVEDVAVAVAGARNVQSELEVTSVTSR